MQAEYARYFSQFDGKGVAYFKKSIKSELNNLRQFSNLEIILRYLMVRNISIAFLKSFKNLLLFSRLGSSCPKVQLKSLSKENRPLFNW